jgi:monofunctional biosynthetic peptidoglycan transglycosylase
VLWAAVLLGTAFAGYEYLTLPDVQPLAHENPKTTALIETRAEEARAQGKRPRRRQSWVALDAVSRHTIDAVVLAEDASFYLHDGIDTVELRKAVEEAIEKGSLGRGASTIPQQLAKNLWLSNQRSLLRKAKEMVLARRLDDALTKRRILALYLNVVEWGDGVYGIQAAAEEHFGVSARDLSAAQGAMLAAMLPNPRQRIPRNRPKGMYRYASRIVGRMQAAHRLTTAEAEQAHRELSEFFGLSQPPPVEEEEEESEGFAEDGES